MPERSTRLDRVSRPDPTRLPSQRAPSGKEALYSTSPQAEPSRPVQVQCDECDVARGLGVRQALCLLRPPFLLNPLNGRLWTRCPSCGERTWLRVRQGQALRALLDRSPSGRG